MARNMTPEEIRRILTAVVETLHLERVQHKLAPLVWYKVYTEPQAALYLGKSVRTMKRWRRQKAHARYSQVGGHIRYLGEDIAWLYAFGTDRLDPDLSPAGGVMPVPNPSGELQEA